MSYLVLARKLRPTRFQDLVGQDHIWKTLLNAIETDRVAHAFLFTGPRGTGKTSCARILTKALNCSNPVNHEPCNQCENCLEINKGISADVMEIDAASNRGIEHIRELRDGVKFSPAKCRYKTYIIDEVHMLTTESFNALLKTLEEPPSHVKFILATTDPHKIPTTVISRCQRYDFTNISIPVMVKHLEWVAQKENLKISSEALRIIAGNSAGGMRDALTTMDMLISFSGTEISDEKVIEILGVNDYKEIDELLAAIVRKDLSRALGVFQTLLNKGRSLAQLVADLMKSIKDLSLVKSLPAEQLQWHSFLPAQQQLYSELAVYTTVGTLQQYFNILLEVEMQIKRSAQARVCIEMGLVKLCAVESLVGVGEFIAALRDSQIPSRKPLAANLQKLGPETVGQATESAAFSRKAQINAENVQNAAETPVDETVAGISESKPTPVENTLPEDPKTAGSPLEKTDVPEVLNSPEIIETTSLAAENNSSATVENKVVSKTVTEDETLQKMVAGESEAPVVPAENEKTVVAETPEKALTAVGNEQLSSVKVQSQETQISVAEQDKEKQKTVEDVGANDPTEKTAVIADLPNGVQEPSVAESQALANEETARKQIPIEPAGDEDQTIRKGSETTTETAMAEPPDFFNDVPALGDPLPAAEPRAEEKEEPVAAATTESTAPETPSTPDLEAETVTENTTATKISKEEAIQLWKEFVDRIAEKHNKSLVSLLRNAILLKLTDQELEIGFNNVEVFNLDKKKEIADLARTFFNPNIKVFYRSRKKGIDASLKQQDDDRAAQQIADRKVAARSNTLVTKVLDNFPGSEIKKVTITEELEDNGEI